MDYVDGGGRNLRAKARKVYDDSKIDDEIEGRRTFDVEEKLHDPKFNQTLSEILLELEGKDFDLKFVQENGFNNPILFKSKEGLGLSVPDAECFSVIDVKSYVGARRVLDVFDCDTHDAEQMTVQRWVQYYTSDERTKIKNVTSLEFSHTGLDRLVDCPKVIRDDLDMVWQMWPKHLIAQQKDSTNTIVNMKYPKIRKYCLMSVAGCYTDWHIDFGGTSVWYHILKGSKVFWLSPPEEENLKQYEKWVLSGRQQTVFLGDLLKQCYRVHLVAGDTFLIPTGWLHAVYTPDDSLVFGGNFIHQYNIPMQLRVYEIEENTKVPQRLRFPFYAEMHWYLIKTYVDLLERDQDEKRMKVFAEDIGEGVFKVVKEELSDHEDLASKAERAKCGWDPVYLTHFEVEGFKQLVEYMRRWTYGKERVPKDLGEDGMSLLERLEELIEYHEDDDQILASSGVNPVMQLQQASLDCSTTANSAYKNGDHESHETGDIGTSSVRKNHVWAADGLGGETDFKSSYRTVRKNGSVPGRKANFRLASLKRAVGASKETKAKKKTSSFKSAIRRVRCHNCEGCQESNCNECRFCLDMPKNGGEGKLRQSCALRYCRNPQFPSSVGCAICRQNLQNCPDPLMECSICQEIVHPKCLKVSKPCKISKKINNCWECPKCCSPHDDETTEFSEDKVGGVVSQFRYRFNSEIRRALGKTGNDGNKRKRRLQHGDDVVQNGKAIRRSKSFENGNGVEETHPSEDSGSDDYDGDDDEPLISQTAPDKVKRSENVDALTVSLQSARSACMEES